MEKKNKIALITGSISLVVICIGIIVFFNMNGTNAPVVPVEESQVSSQESTQVSVPEIKIDENIVLNASSTPTMAGEATKNAKDVTKTDENGVEVQTPNWEAQKELTDDSDLENPDKEPEYKVEQERESQKTASSTTSKASTGATSSTTTGSNNTTSSSTSSSSTTTTNNDTAQTKTENGKTYIWVDSFGWIESDPSTNTTTIIDAPTTGNQVGH